MVFGPWSLVSWLRANIWLVLVLLLALALRLLLWSQPLHQPANDEVEYITVARDLLAGRGWQFYEHYHWLRAPLYPLFLAGSLWLAGGDPAGGAELHRAALPNIALSVATVFLAYRLALALAGRRAAALLAALLTAILWTLATFASLYMSETLFTFLFTGGLLCLARANERPATGGRRPRTNDLGRTTKAERPRIGDAGSGTMVSGRWSLVLAGILFGLATLTRSATLLFLPIVAGWLLLRTADDRRPTTGGEAVDSKPQAPSPKRQAPSLNFQRSGLWSFALGHIWRPLVFLLAVAAVIAPWTIRNYVAYGRPILVETGLSYNLWAFNEPREDQDTIFHVLENIPNPADRSDYATAKGLARLREDPMILWRKLWPGWVYLWRVKPIEDRFIQESYYSDVGLPLFAAAFVFDDVLGLLIVLAGMAGLVLYRRVAPPPAERGALRRLLARARHPRVLLAAWVIYAVATMLLTHAETRYRHFLYPVLIPYAAWLLTRFAHREPRTTGDGAANQAGPNAAQLFSIALLWSLIGAVWLVNFPRDWLAENMARGWHALQAEVAWSAGDPDMALREDRRALDVRATPDGWLRLGDHARAGGDTALALKAYRSAVALAPPYVPAVARLGDLLRELGDARGARAAFVGDYVDQQWLADWSWRELRPAPRASLAIGDGLDFGYVGGMYLPEKQAGALVRWTNGDGRLRLAAPASGAGVLRLRLAAPRPSGAPARVAVCVEGRCVPIELGPEWRSYVLPVVAESSGSLVVDIQSDTFESPEGRRLGVLIDSAALAPANGS